MGLRYKRTARQLEQIRVQNTARNAALSRIIAAHPEEYRRYYEEEALKRGVTPMPNSRYRPKAEKVKELIAEVIASGVLDDVDIPEREIIPTGPEREAHLPANPVLARQRMTRADQIDAAAAGVPYRKPRPDFVPVPPPPF